MSKFNEKYLHEVVDIRVSNVDKKIYPSKYLVQLCNYMDVYSNDYISSKISFTTGSADINEIQKFGLKIDDVIITKDSETPDDIAVSSVVIEDLKNVVCGYHLAILRPNRDELDGKYLMFKLKSDELKRYFLIAAKGSTRFGLTIGDIENVKIKFPSLPTQQHIAKILSTADAVIEKTQAAIAKYKAIKQGMLQDLLTRGIDINTNKLRPRYEDAPHLYKESKLGWIPREWECEVLSDNCERISVGIATSSTEYFEEQGVLFLRNQNIKENIIDTSDILYINQAFADANSSKYLNRGDVITVRTGYPGLSAVVELEHEGAQTFTTLITTPKMKEFNSYFLAYFINSDFGRKQVLNLQGGSAQQNLNAGALETMRITKPGLLEQNEIVRRLKSCEKNIETEQAYLQKMQLIRRGLMEDLLSGKKQVKVVEELVTQNEN